MMSLLEMMNQSFNQAFQPPLKEQLLRETFRDGFGYRGGIYPGLTFRFVKSGDPCPPETSEEICIFDEETSTDADLNGSGKVALNIITPEVNPPAYNYHPTLHHAIHRQQMEPTV